MRRVIVASVDGNMVGLSQEDQYHLIRVLRMGDGDFFEALCRDGRRFKCRLTHSAGRWQGIVTAVSEQGWESPCSIVLAQALLKHDHFEWVLQKAAELGVSALLPLLTVRTEIELKADRIERRMDRWRRILLEAVKQCGRTGIPKLLEPASLRTALESLEGVRCLAPDEEGAQALSDCVSSWGPTTRCCVFIGPEGGWDESDRVVFHEFGVPLVRIGPRVLRAETAAVCALSLLQYELGDLRTDPGSFRIDYEHFDP